MQYLKHTTIAIFIFIIFSGQKVFACSLCVESLIHIQLPFMVPAIVLLGCWRIIYGIFQLKTTKSKTTQIIGKALGRIFAVILASLLLIRAALLFYLLLSFSKAIIQTHNRWWKNRNSRLSQAVIALHGCTLVILLAIVVGGYIQKYSLDPIDRIKKYVLPGTAFECGMVEKLAADSKLDINKLRDMMRNHGTRDEDLAYHILMYRKSLDDLIYLKDEVLKYPDLENALSDNWDATSMYCRYWLHSIGVEDSIRKKEELKNWIEKAENADKSSRAIKDPVINQSTSRDTPRPFHAVYF